MDSFSHCFVFIRNLFLLLLIAVPQEDGIVQRDTQLQYRGDCLGYVADLSQEVICSHVPENRYSDANQEDQRQQERIHCDHQYDRAQRHSDRNINAFLFLHKLFCISHDGGQAGNKALLSGCFADLPDCFHCLFRRGTFIEENSCQHTITAAEPVPDI